MKCETILTINGMELISINGSYQIYNKEDVCVASLRGNFTKIKKYFKSIAR